MTDGNTFRGPTGPDFVQNARKPPRVVLLTLPGIFGGQTINRMAEQAGLNLVGVGLSKRIYRKRSALSGIVTFQRRTGWNYLLYNGLISDVSWMSLRMSGRPRGLRRAGIRPYGIHDVNSPPTLRWLESLSPDYIVSCYFNQWIGSEVRSRATQGCLNMHPALLPALRGPDPAFRALERGLDSTGLTIHDVADDIDAGTIHHQESICIPENSSVFGLYTQLIELGCDRLARYVSGSLVPTRPEQLLSSDDYTTFPTPAEVNAYRNSGGKLITWQEWKQALAKIE